MKRMVDDFLACPADRIVIFQCIEDFFHADKPYRKIEPQRLRQMQAGVAKHREVDLRAQWPVLDGVVKTAWGHQLRATMHEEENVMMLDGELDLPFPEQPHIAFLGWHQIRDDEAILLFPARDIGKPDYLRESHWADDKNEEICVEVVKQYPNGTFLVQSGGYIGIREAEWMTCVTMARADGEMSPLEVFERMRDAVEDSPEDIAQNRFQSMLTDPATLLLAHTLIAADPGIQRVTTVPPGQRKKGSGKGGKRTVPGRRWIDLPGLRYDGRNWSADPRTPGGVRWHRVRGTYRFLRSEKFTHKQGTKVYVRPHTRGTGEQKQGPGYRAKAG